MLIYFVVGIFFDGFVFVVLKFGVGVMCEDMRFYVKDLLIWIKIGDCEMKY